MPSRLTVMTADDPPELHPNNRTVTAAAAERGLRVEVVDYPAGTRTAADAARAIGCSVGQIVKSLVFAVGPIVGDPAGHGSEGASMSDGGGRDAGSDRGDAADGELVLALVSGANQLDEAALGRVAGRSADIRRVDAERVRQATGFPIGGVPPIGHRQALRTFVDADLVGYAEVWAAAGTPTSVFRLTPDDLVRVTQATVAELRRT
jgi:prolyl-tRNA editing enzyme YbaK/EbsC (Cys-tRNA(Pro) deacylase)